MKAIKICRLEEKKLVSAFSDGIEVEYRLGEWTKRPKDGGPLAVFDTLKHAEEFMEVMSLNHQAYACEIKKSDDSILWCYKKEFVLPRLQKSFLPRGTILADEVKLIKKVESKIFW